MNEQAEYIYKKAVKNKEFLTDIKKADNDKKPGYFADEVERSLFSLTYYGWIVGKYGPDNWEEKL